MSFSKMAGQQNVLHVCEFSANKKLLAFIDLEGKLKIWDTEINELKHDYAPNLQVSAPCSCLVWVVFKGRKNKQSIEEDNLKYIALGTKKGGISIYSCATGKIDNKLKGNGHSGAVSNICFNNSDLLYTCGDDCKVIIWNLSTGTEVSSWSLNNERPTCITLSQSKDKIITASRQIKIWSNETHTTKQTFTGHISNVCILKTFQYDKSEFLISASKLDRILSMWNLNASSKKKDAVATFVIDDPAISIDLNCNGQNLIMVAVGTSGVLYYFIENINEIITSVKPLKSKLKINIVADSSTSSPSTIVEPIPIITATLLSSTNEKILVGYGDRQYLRFESIEPDFQSKIQVLIRDDPRKVMIRNKDKNFGQITPHINENNVEYSMLSTPNKKIMKTIEIPMEQRLENLSFTIGHDGEQISQARNMTQLLIQGLHSKDANILREVLSTTHDKSIQLTLQKLPPQYIGTLINELTTLMQKKISHVEVSVAWLKILVQTHTSQLMALGADDLLSRFGPCLGIIEHRVNNLKSLTRVRGRLDLLLNQIRRNRKQDEDAILNNENLLVHQDEETDSDTDIGENKGNLSSDDHWEESNDEDDDDDNDDEEDNEDNQDMEVSDE